jgi:hypothetical protein
MRALLCFLFVILWSSAGSPCSAQAEAGSESGHEQYLRWDGKRANKVALSTRVNGQVGKSLDFRILHTERSYNFKLRATWLTPEVIRARARLVQLAERLPDDDARALVAKADLAETTIILIEIDPREGSGIIPLDWAAFLQARGTGAQDPSSRGTIVSGLGDLRALGGGFRRDYAYDSFWMAFPLRTEKKEWNLDPQAAEVELVVRIYGKVGKVRWPMPDSVRARLRPGP